MTEYEWINKMKALADTAHTIAPLGGEMFPPSLYYRFLKSLALWRQPKLSVVLGVCGGGCCLHLASGWEQGQVIGIDIADDYPKNMEYILARHENFEFRIADAVLEGENFGKSVDILFIDTTHTYEQTMAEYDAWKPMLSKGATIVLDDLDRPGMEEAFDEIPGWRVRLDEMSPGGFGVIKHV